jgi:hypothetical protein
METLVKQDDNLTNAHSFFVSKEHYLSFRAAWKQYIADGKHKRATYIDAWGGRCKEPSSLTAAHHLMLCVNETYINRSHPGQTRISYSTGHIGHSIKHSVMCRGPQSIDRKVYLLHLGVRLRKTCLKN